MYQPKILSKHLIEVLDSEDSYDQTRCHLNAMIALDRIPEVERYVLGWVYSKTTSVRTESAWIKIGNNYYDPSLRPNTTTNIQRYSPCFELTNDELLSIIYSKLSTAQQERMMKGLILHPPPTISDVLIYSRSNKQDNFRL